MVHRLIATSSKSRKETKHFRNPAQNPSSSTIACVQRDKAQRSPSNEIGLLKRERLPLWQLQGGRDSTFRRKLQQTALCPRARQDTRQPYSWRCSPVQLKSRQSHGTNPNTAACSSCWGWGRRVHGLRRCTACERTAQRIHENRFYENYRNQLNIRL